MSDPPVPGDSAPEDSAGRAALTRARLQRLVSLTRVLARNARTGAARAAGYFRERHAGLWLLISVVGGVVVTRLTADPLILMAWAAVVCVGLLPLLQAPLCDEPSARFTSINEARRTMIQLCGAGALLIGGLNAWEQLRHQQTVAQAALETAVRSETSAAESRLTERLADATARLSASGEFERVSGVHLLGRVASSGAAEAAAVADILCAFVRQRAAWTSDARHKPETLRAPENYMGPLPHLHRPPADVQTALDVLRSRPWPVKLDLSFTDLQGANLANLQAPGGRFEGAHFEGAILKKANLASAYLWAAHLQGSNLSGANLRSAELVDADLSRAELILVNLSHATAWGVSLRDAHLRKSDLSFLHGERMDFTGAYFAELNDLRGAFLQRTKGLTIAMIEDAYVDNSTKLPTDLRQQVDRLRQSNLGASR